VAHVDPILSAAPIAGIAEPHQSTVAGILHAVGQGLFTVSEAELLIDRVRAHVTAVPLHSAKRDASSVEDVLPFAGSGARIGHPPQWSG
jgi:hypothetical protein